MVQFKRSTIVNMFVLQFFEVSLKGTVSTSKYPFSSYYKSRRCQTIYLRSEIAKGLGDSNAARRIITAVQLKPSQLPGTHLNNFRIEYTLTNDTKVCSVAIYRRSCMHSRHSCVCVCICQVSSWKKTFPCYGPKRLSTDDLAPDKWATFELTTPIEWDGTSNLLLQYSHNGNTSSPDRGYAVAVNTGQSTRSRYYCTDSSYSYPFNNSSDNSTNMVQVLRLGFEGYGGGAVEEEGPKGILGMLSSECGLNSKWVKTALQLTELRLETEAKEAESKEKAIDEPAPSPDATQQTAAAASAEATAAPVLSSDGVADPGTTATESAPMFRRGDLVRMVSTEMSKEESELLPGPLLSFEIGDVFEIDQLRSQACAGISDPSAAAAAGATATNKQYFCIRALPTLWMPTSCCTLLRKGDGFSKGDKVVVKGVGQATLHDRASDGAGWFVCYGNDSTPTKRPVAVEKLLTHGQVREPRNFRVRGEMYKGGDSTFEVLAYEHVVVPELYIFALYDNHKWHLVGVSLESICARSTAPRAVDCKVMGGSNELRNLPMTAAVASQMWDGTFEGHTTTKSRKFSVRNVISEEMDPNTPDFPSQWIICYDFVVLRKGADLSSDKILDSETSSELKMGTVVDIAETHRLSSDVLRMRVTAPVKGWITQTLNDDCKIVRRFTGVDKHPMHPHPLKLAKGNGK